MNIVTFTDDLGDLFVRVGPVMHEGKEWWALTSQHVEDDWDIDKLVNDLNHKLANTPDVTISERVARKNILDACKADIAAKFVHDEGRI